MFIYLEDITMLFLFLLTFFSSSLLPSLHPFFAFPSSFPPVSSLFLPTCVLHYCYFKTLGYRSERETRRLVLYSGDTVIISPQGSRKPGSGKALGVLPPPLQHQAGFPTYCRPYEAFYIT